MAVLKQILDQATAFLDKVASGLASGAVLGTAVDPGEATEFILILNWRVVSLVAATDPTVTLKIMEETIPGGPPETWVTLNTGGQALARGTGEVSLRFDGTASLARPSGTPLHVLVENASADAGAAVTIDAWVRWFYT